MTRICRNHVADSSCKIPKTNAFMPDAGMIVYRTKVDAPSDPQDFSGYVRSYGNHNGVHSNTRSGDGDYKGFQRCPEFCKDPSNALCTMYARDA